MLVTPPLPPSNEEGLPMLVTPPSNKEGLPMLVAPPRSAASMLSSAEHILTATTAISSAAQRLRRRFCMADCVIAVICEGVGGVSEGFA